MKMTNPAAWAHLGGPPAYPFEDMVDNGEAVSVSTAARQHFGCSVTVAIEASAYDRFVCWDSAATRRLGLTLTEWERLDNLLAASCIAAFGAGGIFVCRAIDSRGLDGQQVRHVLAVNNVGEPGQPKWLITDRP